MDNDMFLVNETDKWSFKLNPPIGGTKQLGTKKKVAIRTEAEMKLARKLAKRHGKRLSIKRLKEIESQEEEIVNKEKGEDVKDTNAPEVEETIVPEPQEEIEETTPIEVPEEEEDTQEKEVIDVTANVIEPPDEPGEEDVDSEDEESADSEEEEEVKDTLSINVGDICVTDVSGKEVDVEIIDLTIEEDGSISYKGINQNTRRVVSILPDKKRIFKKKEETPQRLSLSECE